MRLTAYRPTAELVRLVDALGGSWSGYRALCRCPAHADKTPSLSVRQGDCNILVHCFAGCKSSDVLREMARIARIPATQSVDRRDHEDRPNVNVLRLWNESVDISGTLAARYLDRRAIGSDFSDLRYNPRCPRGVKPNTVFAPALMVAARTDTELLAIQRIFLAPDGRALEKLMIGRPGGASWRGSAPVDGRLAIAEGFETAARFTTRTGIPCWASLGAARLPLIALPADLTELVIAEDDDAEGRAAARRAWRAYARSGLSIRRMPPPHRADLKGDNDWARLD
jgi:Toprim domain